MRPFLSLFVTACLLLSPVQSQEYQDSGYGDYDQGSYEQDNLYHDYATRQQDKEAGR